MKLLVIGLGSMGKRRIRCLKGLGYKYIWGYDESVTTAQSVFKEYEIDVCFRKRDLKNWIAEFQFDAMFVCTPPTTKDYYVELANNNGIPCFCEADIVAYEGDYCPSRTMIYHPAVKKIKELVRGREIGATYAFTYHLGQHIKDWHPGANYSSYYAVKKETGGCREMFCFEVAWLSWVFGAPLDAKGFVSKQMADEEVAADDVYAAIVKFQCSTADSWWFNYFIHPLNKANKQEIESTVTGTVLVDIVSRPPVRELVVIGSEGMLKWNWGGDCIDLITKDGSRKEKFDRGHAAKGYNENIPEQMYVDEVKAFMHDVLWRKSGQISARQYDYFKDEEAKVIDTLRRVEE